MYTFPNIYSLNDVVKQKNRNLQSSRTTYLTALTSKSNKAKIPNTQTNFNKLPNQATAVNQSFLYVRHALIGSLFTVQGNSKIQKRDLL